MAGERIRLEVQEREQRGTRDSRRLRKEGLIPGVLYGRGNKPHPICVQERELRARADGRPRPARDPRRRPRGPDVHARVDPQGVPGRSDPREDRALRPPGSPARPADPVRRRRRARRRVRRPKAGGVLSQVSREIRVEALPMEIPERIELDVTAMEIGDSLRLPTCRRRRASPTSTTRRRCLRP